MSRVSSGHRTVICCLLDWDWCGAIMRVDQRCTVMLCELWPRQQFLSVKTKERTFLLWPLSFAVTFLRHDHTMAFFQWHIVHKVFCQPQPRCRSYWKQPLKRVHLKPTLWRAICVQITLPLRCSVSKTLKTILKYGFYYRLEIALSASDVFVVVFHYGSAVSPSVPSYVTVWCWRIFVLLLLIFFPALSFAVQKRISTRLWRSRSPRRKLNSNLTSFNWPLN